MKNLTLSRYSLSLVAAASAALAQTSRRQDVVQQNAWSATRCEAKNKSAPSSTGWTAASRTAGYSYSTPTRIPHHLKRGEFKDYIKTEGERFPAPDGVRRIKNEKESTISGRSLRNTTRTKTK